MKYALENDGECERLEKQSSQAFYDYKKELAGVPIPERVGSVVLDAGCGSGIVARYLAKRFSELTVIGCDASPGRVEWARKAGEGVANLSFRVSDLTALDLAPESVDAAICRYVLEHLPASPRQKALEELYRSLKPGGTLTAIDFDGGFLNLYPRTELVDEVLNRLESHGAVDLKVGRKLPALLGAAGFGEIRREVSVMDFHGSDLRRESELMSDRLDQAMPYLESFLGDKPQARRFKGEFLECLNAPDVVYFCTKFIVTGRKPFSAHVVQLKRK